MSSVLPVSPLARTRPARTAQASSRAASKVTAARKPAKEPANAYEALKANGWGWLLATYSQKTINKLKATP